MMAKPNLKQPRRVGMVCVPTRKTNVDLFTTKDAEKKIEVTLHFVLIIMMNSKIQRFIKIFVNLYTSAPLRTLRLSHCK